jgi:hypothetical protein
MTRNCLKCGKGFEADGRFNRICKRCDRSNESLPARLLNQVAGLFEDDGLLMTITQSRQLIRKHIDMID